MKASFREYDFRVNDFSKHQFLAKIILKIHGTDFNIWLLEYAHLAFKKWNSAYVESVFVL